MRKPRPAFRSWPRAAVKSVVGITMLAAGIVLPTVTADAAPGAATPTTQVAACAAPSGQKVPSAATEQHVRVGKADRTYRVHVPAGYSGTTRTPLILAFHGRAEKGTTLEKYTQMSRLPAIVVYPDGLRGNGGATAWQGAPYASSAADDIGFTRAILREVRARYCVDDGRTYAVGRSNGAGLVSILSCVMPDEFAAFGTVSGAFYDSGERWCAKPKPVSLINFHGTNDDVIRYNGGVRHGGRYQGVDAWLDRRITANGCFPMPIETSVAPAVQRRSWPICLSVGHEIVNYRITGGTHRWPGSIGGRTGGASDNINATTTIWQFLKAHPRAAR